MGAIPRLPLKIFLASWLWNAKILLGPKGAIQSAVSKDRQ